jgi:hypothetical protein
MCRYGSRRWRRTCALELTLGREAVRLPVVRRKIGLFSCPPQCKSLNMYLKLAHRGAWQRRA